MVANRMNDDVRTPIGIPMFLAICALLMLSLPVLAATMTAGTAKAVMTD